MDVITAPHGFHGRMQRPLVFMAGGISNCPDWQHELIDFMENQQAHSYRNLRCTFFNPRRENFPIENKTAAAEQVAWEFYGFRLANIILFWFAKGSLNPIVLYELGAHCHRENIVVGCDPEYSQTQDVQLQLALTRPGQQIHHDFERFSWAVKQHIIDWGSR